MTLKFSLIVIELESSPGSPEGPVIEGTVSSISAIETVMGWRDLLPEGSVALTTTT